ncbi:MAG: AAA family ATPase [Roseovarius sp.]|nr:AAA family ATPase [Roseovarius sp.]
MQFWSVADLEGQPIPQSKWLLDKMIPSRNVTLLSGDGSTGKSLLALQLAAATAAGHAWLGRPPDQRGPALFVSAEDDDEELQIRFADVAAAEGITMAELADLHTHSFAGQDATLAMPDRRTGALVAIERLTALEAAIARYQPKLVVLDTLSDLFGGEENSRPQARTFIGMLRGLALRHDCAVVLLSHPSQHGLTSGWGTSGSTAWNNSVRSRLYFQPITDGGYEPDTNARRLTLKKSNYGPSGEEIMIRYDAGRSIVEGGAEGTGLDRMAAGAKAQRVVMALLQQFESQGRHVSPHPGPTFLPTVFAAEPGSEGCTRQALNRAMSELFAAGRIETVEYGPPSKRRTKIIEVKQ